MKYRLAIGLLAVVLSAFGLIAYSAYEISGEDELGLLHLAYPARSQLERRPVLLSAFQPLARAELNRRIEGFDSQDDFLRLASTAFYRLSSYEAEIAEEDALRSVVMHAIEHTGDRINVRLSSGDTLLSAAVLYERWDIAEKLLAQGANPCDELFVGERTLIYHEALDRLSEGGDVSVSAALERAGEKNGCSGGRERGERGHIWTPPFLQGP